MELLNTGGLSRAASSRRRATSCSRGARPIRRSPRVRLNALEDKPTLHVDVDAGQGRRARASRQADVNSTLSTAWGGSYVNDFIDRGRVKRVYVQGDAPYRSRAGGSRATGTCAPAAARWRRSPPSPAPPGSQAPTTLIRFNGVSAYEIQGQAAPGRSSGEAMDRMAALAAQLPGVSVDVERPLLPGAAVSGGQAPYLYAISLLVVFLCLAALYESWSIPVSVLLVIPLGLVGAIFAVTLRGLDNDVFFQVGLLTTMGLAAEERDPDRRVRRARGEAGAQRVIDAALEAARIRLRPILMTSLSFMAGVFPLAIATGAGANSRIAIGTAVIGGMLTATILADLLHAALLRAGPPLHPRRLQRLHHDRSAADRRAEAAT